MTENEISVYIALLVKHAGGEVRIPFDDIEQGLPAGHGIKITPDPKTEELVFTFGLPPEDDSAE